MFTFKHLTTFQIELQVWNVIKDNVIHKRKKKQTFNSRYGTLSFNLKSNTYKKMVYYL